mmetsp:Transcript_3794/g.8073  ORF Transcript_3794/g.8073 Transcript_3794/m.8073 type:complete len:128 (-) Transcript_3794:88-471(-)|eukprot:CAMPEP_0204912606 /NCGR_PEP_ID=MMETSP1397-20131031/10725_1 /ASSEMBLY_ACC=CAM_ASM_000891 /TAXON_ID=49980 /ORGANISM="Climacostomum Climacostomum virens, Strain Stock W-24" /LENGTH=127 /DNA_ID=CAMNT_0052083613 /DNA_START=104 /DNA_END=484 /DNA_ORIENTATION=+
MQPEGEAGFFERGLKMVIVVRDDLGMGRGKIAAQCCHACLGAYQRQSNKAILEEWESRGGKKVVLRALSEEQLVGICETAQALGLPSYLVIDAGHTQIAPGSITAVGIGPAYEELFEPVTGHLRLLN